MPAHNAPGFSGKGRNERYSELNWNDKDSEEQNK